MLTTLAPDTELAPAGRTIRAGDTVVVRHASADRDERAFAGPGRPDLARAPSPGRPAHPSGRTGVEPRQRAQVASATAVVTP
ncbi:hypothetical protein ACWEQC_39335 [Streptomyces shenzhenensis]